MTELLPRAVQLVVVARAAPVGGRARVDPQRALGTDATLRFDLAPRRFAVGIIVMAY